MAEHSENTGNEPQLRPTPFQVLSNYNNINCGVNQYSGKEKNHLAQKVSWPVFVKEPSFAYL